MHTAERLQEELNRAHDLHLGRLQGADTSLQVPPPQAGAGAAAASGSDLVPRPRKRRRRRHHGRTKGASGPSGDKQEHGPPLFSALVATLQSPTAIRAFLATNPLAATQVTELLNL